MLGLNGRPTARAATPELYLLYMGGSGTVAQYKSLALGARNKQETASTGLSQSMNAAAMAQIGDSNFAVEQSQKTAILGGNL